MNIDDDTNPFADSSIRQATAPSFPNQQASNEYNPFTNTTAPARPAQPPQQSFSAVLPPAQTPVYQPPASPAVYQPAVYQSPVQPTAYQPPSYASTSTPTAAQQATEKYGNDTRQTSTNVDLGAFDRQQAELAEREKRLAQREQEIKAATPGTRANNFPPLPKICPCGPCFYQDISVDIPAEFQLSVRHVYYLWIVYSVTLFLNMIAALSYFLVDKDGAATFGLSLVYLILFIPASYIGWFRTVYRAFSGFARLGVMSTNQVVGIMMIILGCLWSLISLAAVFLTIKVHRLYRLSGASLDQAQKELQTAFVNNETVRGAARGAAREVASAGINEALRST